jgi:uncharacterized membrane protein YbaN (DUF454 family)
MTVKKTIYKILGFIFFGLGLFGYYAPLFPGTIFMIISAYFFMYSSDRLYQKVINNPLYGKPIKDYIENNTIPLKSKIIILLSIWIATFISIYITPDIIYPLGKKLFNFNIVINFKFVGIMLSIIGSIFVLKTKSK